MSPVHFFDLCIDVMFSAFHYILTLKHLENILYACTHKMNSIFAKHI